LVYQWLVAVLEAWLITLQIQRIEGAMHFWVVALKAKSFT
jgi:hypothetical protein